MNWDDIEGKWHQLKAVRITVSLLALVALVGLSACGSTQPVGTQWDDNVITSKVKAKLIADPQVKAFDISVTTNEGIVTLTGRVKEQLQRTEAEKLARDTAGVKGVNNLIKVGELPPPVVRPGASISPQAEDQKAGARVTDRLGPLPDRDRAPGGPLGPGAHPARHLTGPPTGSGPALPEP